jgi:simple sugar transport system ATP-binding protein
MKNISKRFADVQANEEVCFDVERGEVHALLGENGAGKTTLMNILYGLYTPDRGEIYLDGISVQISSPRKAIELRIGMIHQHFMLIPQLSVAENIILGFPLSRGPLLNIKKAEDQIEEISKKYELSINPKILVGRLSVGLQQRVEILKALYRNIDLLILDEPTSVLTPLEVEALFNIIRRLTQEGIAVIFISHKLKEVMTVSHRITVLRRGRTIETVRTVETSPNRLAKMMVGEEVKLDLEKTAPQRGKKLLEIYDLWAAGEHEGKPILKNVSFDLHRGEILGVAGVDGNGQSELAEAITGLRLPMRGKVVLDGVDITLLSPRKRIDLKLSYIPPDRHQGLITDFSIAENLILKSFRTPSFSRRGFLLNDERIHAYADRMIENFNIKAPHRDYQTSSLSGGNQQKVTLARELSGNPYLLIAVQPTRGLDIASTKYVHQSIVDHRQRGGATLLISTELDEVISLSDRIAVMFEGEIMDILPGGEQVDLVYLSLLMAGVKKRMSSVQAL